MAEGVDLKLVHTINNSCTVQHFANQRLVLGLDLKLFHFLSAFDSEYK